MINDFTSRWHWWDDTDGGEKALGDKPVLVPIYSLLFPK
jgi:hypothetical protein